MEEFILKEISKEIEKKYNCKVISIRIVELLSICVMSEIQFNDDFIYKPFKDLPTPLTICFSERTISFTKRVDLFDCIKKLSKSN